jgi:hypothetical protein
MDISKPPSGDDVKVMLGLVPEGLVTEESSDVSSRWTVRQAGPNGRIVAGLTPLRRPPHNVRMTGTADAGTTTPLDFNLDAKVFDMVSSSASVVDTDAPTRFVYHETHGVLWGEYVGDTVSIGRFCGVRTGERIDISFVHRNRAGDLTTRGEASSIISRSDDGALVLTEDFIGPDGQPHVSVCREIPAA